MITVKRGTLIRNKQTLQKEAVFETKEIDENIFEIILCDTWHEDGDFSYICTNDWCRCKS